MEEGHWAGQQSGHGAERVTISLMVLQLGKLGIFLLSLMQILGKQKATDSVHLDSLQKLCRTLAI